MTMQQIAQIARVSKRTVSRALNNQYGISEETKKIIFDIAAELNYRPNALARALATKQTKTLGLIVSDIADPFYAKLVRGVEDIAAKNNYSAIIFSTDEDYEKELKSVCISIEKKLDGILLTATQTHNKDILELKERNIPFVLMNRHFDDIETDYVIDDNKKGAYDVVDHLAKLGYKKIAYISGPPQISSVRERLQGYKDALAYNNIDFDKTLVVESNLRMEDGERTTKSLLRMIKNKPIAIFAFSDLLAIGALKAIKEKGLKVPDDIALVGYDDIEFAALLEVPLTTVAQPSYEIGKKAAEILINKLQKQNMSEFQQVVLTPQLVIRKSCGVERKM